MKILFVSYYYWPPHFGGELKLSIERFESLAQNGHSMTVLTCGVPDMPSIDLQDRVVIKRSPQIHDSRWGRGLRRLVFPLWVVFQMKPLEFDIVHFGGIGGITPLLNLFGMMFVIKISQRKRAKTVYVHSLADTESEMFTNRGFDRRIRNIWLNQIDAIVSVSPALYEAVEKHHPKHSHLIVYGVRDDIFEIPDNKKRKIFRDEFDIDEDNVVFSFLGTVSKRKGFDLVADSFQVLANEHPNWRLWIIGPKSQVENQNTNQDAVNALIEPLICLQDSLTYWGRIDNRQSLANILGASDVFLFPSRREGFGIAPLEAMACGIPPIIARIPGVTDLANIENVTGLYCQVNDLDSLKEAMIKLGSDHLLRRKMGMAARLRIVDKFGWKQHVQNWENLYQELLIKKS